MQKFYSTGEAARIIGIKQHRLAYSISNGDVAGASMTFLGKRVFTEGDIERIREYFEKKRKDNQEGKSI